MILCIEGKLNTGTTAIEKNCLQSLCRFSGNSLLLCTGGFCAAITPLGNVRFEGAFISTKRGRGRERECDVRFLTVFVR